MILGFNIIIYIHQSFPREVTLHGNRRAVHTIPKISTQIGLSKENNSILEIGLSKENGGSITYSKKICIEFSTIIHFLAHVSRLCKKSETLIHNDKMDKS